MFRALVWALAKHRGRAVSGQEGPPLAVGAQEQRRAAFGRPRDENQALREPGAQGRPPRRRREPKGEESRSRGVKASGKGEPLRPWVAKQSRAAWPRAVENSCARRAACGTWDEKPQGFQNGSRALEQNPGEVSRVLARLPGGRRGVLLRRSAAPCHVTRHPGGTPAATADKAASVAKARGWRVRQHGRPGTDLC